MRIFRILLALCLFICAIGNSAGDETGLTVDQINQKRDLSRIILDEAHKSLEDANLTDADANSLIMFGRKLNNCAKLLVFFIFEPNIAWVDAILCKRLGASWMIGE